MARIFLSHSSRNNAQAVALRDWLVAGGWGGDDIFLDIDARSGIAPGERWQKALGDAADRCEAVVFLISRDWLASRWCMEELSLAHKLNKRLFGVLIDTVELADVPARLRDEWQLIDLESGRDGIRFEVALPDGTSGFATFSAAGLDRLRTGLVKAGLDPRFFPWPPEHDPDRAPWRGLAPLEEDDAGIFYGREAATIAALDALRGLAEAPPPRLMAILGASGAGKSSFMRAGLIPRLRRDDASFFVLPAVRPERDPISGGAGLVNALVQAAATLGLGWTRAVTQKSVSDGEDALAKRLDELASAAARRMPGATRSPTIVLPIDQAEELFSSEARATGQLLLGLLAGLLRRPAPALMVLATIRTDSYESLQLAPELAGIRQATFSLPALARGAYQRVIEGPAERVAATRRPLRLEPALTAALLADIEEGGAKDALPLLAFTLERLYADHGGDGDLTLAEYEDSGRITGAIEVAVERALAAADGEPGVPRDRAAKLALLRRGLIPWLAGIDPETGTPRRHVARLSDIPAESRPLIDHFVAQRLLSTDISRETGERTVEPAHEALLRQWGVIDGWLKEDIAVLATLEGVRRAARDWSANARDTDWLSHQAGRLEDAERLADRPDLWARLEPTDRTYLAAARTVENARRDRELEEARKLAEAQRVAAERLAQVARRTRVGLAAALLLAAVAGGLGWYGLDRSREAEAQRLIAEDRQGEAERERERAEEQARIAEERQAEAERQSEIARRQEDAAREAATEAERERERAEEQARIAEERGEEARRSAARLAVNVSASLLADGLRNEAALLLIDAAGAFDEETAGHDLHIALHKTLEKLARTRTVPVPPGSVALVEADALYVLADGARRVLRLRDEDATLETVLEGRPEDSPILSFRVVGDRTALFVRQNGEFGRVAFGAGPELIGRLPEPVAREGRTYEAPEVEIGRTGTAVMTWTYLEGDLYGTAVAMMDVSGDAGGPFDIGDSWAKYFLDPEVGEYLSSASFDAEFLRIEREGGAIRLEPATVSDEARAKLEFARCLDNGRSHADFNPFVVEQMQPWFLEHLCFAYGEGVIASYQMSGSGGVMRDDIIFDSEGNETLVNDRLAGVADYSLQGNLTWLGVGPGEEFVAPAIGVLANRDLLVFDDYDLILKRGHEEAPTAARFLGDSRIAAFLPGKAEIVVYDWDEDGPRWALSAPGEQDLTSGTTRFEPLHWVTCSMASDGLQAVAVPDGRTLNIGRREGDSEATFGVVGADGVGAFAFATGASCVSLSRDLGKVLFVLGDRIEIHDVARILESGAKPDTPMASLAGEFGNAFFGPRDAIVASDWSHAVHEWRLGDDGTWSKRQIYLGDSPATHAEPDATGDLLLVLENTGGGGVRGLLYSVSARKEWMSLGDEYKWLDTAFADNGDIGVHRHGQWQRLIRLPTLARLVDEATDYLSPACRPAEAGNPRSSPCWPQWLGGETPTSGRETARIP